MGEENRWDYGRDYGGCGGTCEGSGACVCLAGMSDSPHWRPPPHLNTNHPHAIPTPHRGSWPPSASTPSWRTAASARGRRPHTAPM